MNFFKSYRNKSLQFGFRDFFRVLMYAQLLSYLCCRREQYGEHMFQNSSLVRRTQRGARQSEGRGGERQNTWTRLEDEQTHQSRKEQIILHAVWSPNVSETSTALLIIFTPLASGFVLRVFIGQRRTLIGHVTVMKYSGQVTPPVP